jgi:hypothetical protein
VLYIIDSYKSLSTFEHILWIITYFVFTGVLVFVLARFIIVLAKLTRSSELDKYSIWSFVLLTLGLALQLIASTADDLISLAFLVNELTEYKEISNYVVEIMIFGWVLRNLGLIINIARWLLNQRKSYEGVESSGCLFYFKKHP